MMYIWSRQGDDWWPESMYEVSEQFDKYRTRGVPRPHSARKQMALGSTLMAAPTSLFMEERS